MFGMGLGGARVWLEFTLGGLALGRLLASSSVAPTGWQQVEEATAQPRVGLLDGQSARASLNSQDGTPQLIGTTLIANPGHPQHLWQVEKIGPCRTHFLGPKKNDVFLCSMSLY